MLLSLMKGVLQLFVPLHTSRRAQAAEKYNEEIIIALTKHNEARIRKRALKELCPCRVKDDVPAFWARVLGACCAVHLGEISRLLHSFPSSWLPFEQQQLIPCCCLHI